MPNSPTPETYHLKRTAIAILRIVVGGIFIFSGFAKGIDIWGTEYKINDYITAFGWSWAEPFAGFAAISLALYEFVCGVLLLIGSFRRTIVGLLLAGMAFMLPLSAYIMIANPVTDCGCFGDAITISNSATFWKNIFITAALAYLLNTNNQLRSFYGPAVQWLTALMPALFLFFIAAYGIFIQPLIDFRPYKLGTMLAENDNAADVEFIFTYQKGDIIRDFSIDALPDSSWTFVARKEVVQEKAKETSEATPIAIFDGDEIAENVIPTEGKSLLVLVPDIDEINALTAFQLNDLNDLSADGGISFTFLSGSEEREIDNWKELAMPNYPIYRMDESQLKTIARGNPAIVWLENGVIAYKSTFRAFMEYVDIDNGKIDLLNALNSQNHKETLISAFVAFLLLMAGILLVNRSPLLIKLGLRLKKNQNKEVTLQQENYQTQNTFNTMRKNIVAGNWKMNTTLQEGVKLATEVNEALKSRKPNCDVIIGVPFTHLASIKAVIDENILGLSAENCADKTKGAYTGEVSAAMVASTGAKYVILGHSERRQYYHETSEILKEKVKLALENNLTPIFCIGEVLEERENGTYFDVVKRQVEEALFELSAEDFAKIILAYEPVWAIGTGKTATADQAEEIHAFIRKTIADKYGVDVAENTSILYGGSCKPSNAKELFAKPNVDGGLIGGAALEAESFMGIVDAF